MSYLERIQEDVAQKAKLSQDKQSHYRMYWSQTQTSAFSSKMRAYLNYKNIPYQLIPATLDDYLNNIPKLVGMPILPVILSPTDQVMQDSTPMMAWFEENYSERSATPADERLAWIMWLLEDFGDEYLPRVIMRTRWGKGFEINQRTVAARLARGLSHGQDNETIKFVSNFVMERQKGFSHSLGFETDEQIASIDRQLSRLLTILDEHLTQHGYLLGDKPSLADFAFFGGLWCHCFKDPGSSELFELQAPQVCRWLEEIEHLGDTRGCLGRETFGDWLDLDRTLPDTLLSLLQLVAETYLPQAEAYREAMKNDNKHATMTIDGIELSVPRFDYRAETYAQVQERYSACAESNREWLAQTLASTGLFPRFTEQEIVHNPAFSTLTPPFITDPKANKLSYSGK